MATVAGFPYFELQFTKDGLIFDQNALQDAVGFFAQGNTTDLIVVSHGWNNDMSEARKLYGDLLGHLRAVIDGAQVPTAGRTFAVLGILWPSKKLADDELIPSGAASITSPVTAALISKHLDTLKGVFDNPSADAVLAEAKLLVSQLETSATARSKFADLVRSLPGTALGAADDASDQFFKIAGSDLMDRLAKPALLRRPPPAQGGAAAMGAGTSAGSAAGLASLLGGVLPGARKLLNYTTYYQMKERAGLVGRGGASDALRAIRAKAQDMKVHLVGHSFGGRLVTALALGPESGPAQAFASMTLLQAAFSHNGFAQKFDGTRDGFFRRVVSEHRINGPILVTCTANDTDVGVLYAVASFVAQQNAAGLGDAKDPFGGIGRNGAQHTPEAQASTLAPVGTPYMLNPGAIYNLNSDAIIKNHSDVSKPEVAYAILSAVATT